MSSIVAAHSSHHALAEARAARRVRTARARNVARAEILALALIALALVAGAVISAGRLGPATSSERVKVERGQSLWQLAADHPVSGLSTCQTAELIAGMNGLDGGSVRVGSTIEVPARPGTGLALAYR